MSCKYLSSNICRGCRDNSGGIKRVWAANEKDVDWASVAFDTDGAFTSIPLLNSAVWFILEPNKNSSTYTETITSNVENASIYYSTAVSLVFGKMEQGLRNTVEELGQSEILIVIEMNNGELVVIGEEGNGAVVSGGNGASGTAWGDLNAFTVEFVQDSKSPDIHGVKQSGTPLADTQLWQDLQAVTC